MANADNTKKVKNAWPDSYLQNRLSRKKIYYGQYITDLGQAIHKDLETTGRCSALEETLERLKELSNHNSQWCKDSVPYMLAITKVLMDYSERLTEPIDGRCDLQPYIPKVQTNEQLESCDKTEVPVIKYINAIEKTLSLGKRIFQNLSIQARKTSGKIHIDGPETPRPVQETQEERIPARSSGNDEVDNREPGLVQTSAGTTEAQQREIEKLLQQARFAWDDNLNLQKQLEALEAENRKARSVLNDAQAYKQKSEQEIQEARRQIEQDAEKLKNKSHDEATAIKENAQREAQRIKEAAEQEAARIRQAANTEAESCRTAGKKEADRILEEARKEAKQAADGLVKRYMRMELANQFEPQTVFPTTLAEEVGVSKQNATDGAYKIESTVRTQLECFKYAMQETLDAWRRSLYGQEFRPLARFYQTLYRQLGSGSKTVQTIASQIVRLNTLEAPNEEDTDLLRRLESLQKELASLVTQLGKVMGGLGLEIVLPRKGDLFDRELHSDEDADSGQETITGEINTVRYPAVCGRDAVGERMTILPAAVTVKNSATAGDAT